MEEATDDVILRSGSRWVERGRQRRSVGGGGGGASWLGGGASRHQPGTMLQQILEQVTDNVNLTVVRAC